jgi:hypothetical protein
MRPWSIARPGPSIARRPKPSVPCCRNDSFSAQTMGKPNGTHREGCDSAAARDPGRVSRAATPVHLRNHVSWSRQPGPPVRDGSKPKGVRVVLSFQGFFAGMSKPAYTDAYGVASVEHSGTGQADVIVSGSTRGSLRAPGETAVFL